MKREILPYASPQTPRGAGRPQTGAGKLSVLFFAMAAAIQSYLDLHGYHGELGPPQALGLLLVANVVAGFIGMVVGRGQCLWSWGGLTPLYFLLLWTIYEIGEKGMDHVFAPPY